MGRGDIRERNGGILILKKNSYIQCINKEKKMKTTILNKEVNEEIDWSKPQWVISEDGIIILTSGRHSVDYFKGHCLPCNDYPNGEFSDTWNKSYFKPIPSDGLTIHIQND